MTRLASVRTSSLAHRSRFRVSYRPRLRKLVVVARWVLRVPRRKPRRIMVRAPVRRTSSSGGAEPHLARRLVR